MSSVRILIADDHEVFRRGTQTLLESRPGWHVCGEAATGREAIEKTKKLKPDVVIMDISMPELNGLEAAEQILKYAPQTEVLILTIHDMLGRTIAASNLGLISPGAHKIRISTENWPAGIYTYVLCLNTYMISGKLISTDR